MDEAGGARSKQSGRGQEGAEWKGEGWVSRALEGIVSHRALVTFKDWKPLTAENVIFY